jgi:hypothetical protein
MIYTKVEFSINMPEFKLSSNDITVVTLMRLIYAYYTMTESLI